MTEQYSATINEQKLKNWVEKWEGRRGQAYDDATGKPITSDMAVKGNPTIGVGFNLNKDGAAQKIKALGLDYEQVSSGKQTLNNEQIDQLLEADVKTAVADAKSVIPSFDSLSEDRQIVLTDMAFNLGRDKLSGFKNMADAIKNKDWGKAADEMQDSEWFNQVKNRGKVNVDVMRGKSNVEQHLTSDFSQKPTTNLQKPADLELEKAAYQERYQQLSREIMENPEFAATSPKDIDLGIALSVFQDWEQFPDNLNLEETHNEIAGILSQSSQVREWKENLNPADYLETSTTYIEEIQTSAEEIYQQHFEPSRDI